MVKWTKYFHVLDHLVESSPERWFSKSTEIREPWERQTEAIRRATNLRQTMSTSRFGYPHVKKNHAEQSNRHSEIAQSLSSLKVKN